MVDDLYSLTIGWNLWISNRPEEVDEKNSGVLATPSCQASSPGRISGPCPDPAAIASNGWIDSLMAPGGQGVARSYGLAQRSGRADRHLQCNARFGQPMRPGA